MADVFKKSLANKWILTCAGKHGVWLPDAKSRFTGKDPDAGKDWRLEEKGTTKDEMVGWYHQLNGHEFEQATGIDDGQGGLVCYSPWGCKESDMTEQLTWNDM